MTTLLLSLFLFVQGIPVAAQQTGSVSGVLKDKDGKPLSGIRMAAVTKPDLPGDALTSAAMASIAQTDEQGRYTLENIPPGRYFIAAGRVDMQTFFPGTQEMSTAREVSITSRTKVSGIDFTLNDASRGRANNSGGPFTTLTAARVTTIDIPIVMTVEGGGPLPVSGNGKFTALQLTNLAGGCCSPVPPGAQTVTMTSVQTGAYRVTIENLPETYAVKSMTYGSTNLLTDTLKLVAGNFSIVPAVIQTTAGGLQYQSAIRMFTSNSLPADPAALQAFLAGYTAGAMAAAGNQPPYVPPSTIAITLTRVTPNAAKGVRVAGTLSAAGSRTIFTSGIPGSTFADGTFEIFGVPPGRHSIVTRDNPSRLNPMAASVVVANRDLSGIALSDTALIPAMTWDPLPARAAKNHSEGIVPLARLIGTLVDDSTKQPISEGTVIVKANDFHAGSFPIDSDGHFEITGLLPGTYNLELQIFGHSNVKRSIEIDDEDVKVDLTARRLY